MSFSSGFSAVDDEVVEVPETAAISPEPVDVVVSLSDFLSAGLDPEGIYRLDIKKLAVVEKTVKEGENKGQKYRAIDAEIHLVERFGEGLLAYPVRVFDYNFGTRGRKLERFRKLYTTVFGPLKASDKQSNLSLNDLTASLVGTNNVWSTLYWRRNRNDQSQLEQVLGWEFSLNPSDLRAPKPFAERDQFTQSND